MDKTALEELSRNHQMDDSSTDVASVKIGSVKPEVTNTEIDIDSLVENITVKEPVKVIPEPKSITDTNSVKNVQKSEHVVGTKHGVGSGYISPKSYSTDEIKEKYENMRLDRLGDIWKIYKDKKLTEDQLNTFNILRKIYEKRSGFKLSANTQAKKNK